MDTALRDLDQIRETERDGAGRRTVLVALAVVGGVGVLFAMGMAAARSGGQADDGVDPLARLDRASGLAPEATRAPPARVDIQRESLTFPETLDDDDTRPEVAAAFAAAAAEEQHPDPIDGVNVATAAPPSAAELALGREDEEDVALVHAIPAVEARPASGPAVAAAPAPIAARMPVASATDRDAPALARTATRDPLVRAALPLAGASAGRSASTGHEGPYTLQVISYDEPDEAQAFAAALRARGHQAFVVEAEIAGRGRFWRVRIGPFENMAEAEAYRRRFEAAERMNTLVVRREATDSIARE